MLPLIEPSRNMVQPWNLYLSNVVDKKQFMEQLGNEEISFVILKYLYRYCCEFNEGKWTSITPTVLEQIEGHAKVEINIEESQLFQKGYLVKGNYIQGEYDFEQQHQKPSGYTYLLTHDLIMEMFLAFTDGNWIPLSKHHINFEKKEEIKKLLKDRIGIEEPQAVTFLAHLAYEFEKAEKRGFLVIPIKRSFEIAREQGVISDLGIQWGESRGLIIGDAETEMLTCNALMWLLYWAAPSNLS